MNQRIETGWLTYQLTVNPIKVIQVAILATRFYLDVLGGENIYSLPGVTHDNEGTVKEIIKENTLFSVHTGIARNVLTKLKAIKPTHGDVAVDLNGLESHTLSVACELLKRVSMRQLDLAGYLSHEPTEALKEALNGFHASDEDRANYERAIAEFEMDNPLSMDMAFGLHQAIRYRLSWDSVGNPDTRDWSYMSGVMFDAPMFRFKGQCVLTRI